jgi:hypothetical protein
MSNGHISWQPSKRWHLQTCLTIALAAGILSLGGQTASGQSGRSRTEPGWTLCIRVDDSARVSPGTLARGIEVAARVLLAGGVPTEWRTNSADSSNDPKTRTPKPVVLAPANSVGRNCLILSITRGVSRQAYPVALGFALPYTQTAPDVTIFYDRIERLESRAVSANPTAQQILGYAMAHEIGHVLLGSTQHSSTGIMKGFWGQTEFERLAKGWLGFTTQQSEVMRESAFRRAALSQAAKGKSQIQSSAAHLDVRNSALLTGTLLDLPCHSDPSARLMPQRC